MRPTVRLQALWYMVSGHARSCSISARQSKNPVQQPQQPHQTTPPENKDSHAQKPQAQLLDRKVRSPCARHTLSVARPNQQPLFVCCTAHQQVFSASCLSTATSMAHCTSSTSAAKWPPSQALSKLQPVCEARQNPSLKPPKAVTLSHRPAVPAHHGAAMHSSCC